MKRFIASVLLSIFLCVNVFAVSTADTNYDIIGNGKGIFGKISSGAEKRIIGITTSDAIDIDTDGLGVTFNGDITQSSATTVKPVTTITNTNADANGNYLIFQKLSASPANSDVINTTQYKAYDASANATTYAQIIVKQEDVASSSEDCSIDLQVIKAGAMTSALKVTGGTLTLDVATGNATLTTGNINISVIIGGTTYYIKANTGQ